MEINIILLYFKINIFFFLSNKINLSNHIFTEIMPTNINYIHCYHCNPLTVYCWHQDYLLTQYELDGLWAEDNHIEVLYHQCNYKVLVLAVFFQMFQLPMKNLHAKDLSIEQCCKKRKKKRYLEFKAMVCIFLQDKTTRANTK